MEDFLLGLSNLFVGIAYWVGIPFSLLGILLMLGFQMKNRIVAVIACIALAGISFFPLGLSIEGLVNGEAMTISRHLGVVNKSQTPLAYWIASIFWISSSLCMFGFACWGAYRVINNPALALKRDALKRSP
ncbi:MAG: hypothetical protein V2A34_06815 [Lentisphaerota bacterium]